MYKESIPLQEDISFYTDDEVIPYYLLDDE